MTAPALLAGKIVLISGGTRGLGAGIAREAAAQGAAGLTARGTMLDTTPELFDSHVAINLKAPFFIMSETIKHLRSRGAPGTIVNIVSMSEHAGAPYLAPYVSSKAGLAGLTRNAAHAHRWDKIRINGVNIGWSETAGEDVT